MTEITFQIVEKSIEAHAYEISDNDIVSSFAIQIQ